MKKFLIAYISGLATVCLFIGLIANAQIYSPQYWRTNIPSSTITPLNASLQVPCANIVGGCGGGGGSSTITINKIATSTYTFQCTTSGSVTTSTDGTGQGIISIGCGGASSTVVVAGFGTTVTSSGTTYTVNVNSSTILTVASGTALYYPLSGNPSGFVTSSGITSINNGTTPAYNILPGTNITISTTTSGTTINSTGGGGVGSATSSYIAVYNASGTVIGYSGFTYSSSTNTFTLAGSYPLSVITNTTKAQYAGAGLNLYTGITSTSSNQSGYAIYSGINDSGLSQSFFTISSINASGTTNLNVVTIVGTSTFSTDIPTYLDGTNVQWATVPTYGYQTFQSTGGGDNGEDTILQCMAPSSSPQECTFTLSRIASSSPSNREFTDITDENYNASDTTALGGGVDHMFSINVSKQGTGTLRPFAVRFWNQDLGNIAATGQFAMQVSPTSSAVAFGKYSSSSWSTNNQFQILTANTQTYAFELDDNTAGSSTFSIQPNGVTHIGNQTEVYVSSTPGAFSNQYFYTQNNNSGGVQIGSYNSSFSPLWVDASTLDVGYRATGEAVNFGTVTSTVPFTEYGNITQSSGTVSLASTTINGSLTLPTLATSSFAYISSTGVLTTTSTPTGGGGGVATTTPYVVGNLTVVSSSGALSTFAGSLCGGSQFQNGISASGTALCATPAGGSSSTNVFGTAGVNVSQTGVNATASLDTTYAASWSALETFLKGATINGTTTLASTTNALILTNGSGTVLTYAGSSCGGGQAPNGFSATGTVTGCLTFLTANQTITLTGAVTGSGATTIATTFTTSTLYGLFSNTATGLTYSTTTGATSLTAGYFIPLTASGTQWNAAFASSSLITSALGTNAFNSTAIPTIYVSTFNGTSSAINFHDIGSGNVTTTVATSGGNTTTTITLTGVLPAANGGTATTTALGTCAFLNTCGSGGGGVATTTPYTAGYLQMATTSGAITNSNILQTATNTIIHVGAASTSYSWDQYDHIYTIGATPSVSLCGTGPSISGNDTDMLVLMGTGAPATCTVTFANPYLNNAVLNIQGTEYVNGTGSGGQLFSVNSYSSSSFVFNNETTAHSSVGFMIHVEATLPTSSYQ